MFGFGFFIWQRMRGGADAAPDPGGLLGQWLFDDAAYGAHILTAGF